jgi:MFS family permease
MDNKIPKTAPLGVVESLPPLTPPQELEKSGETVILPLEHPHLPLVQRVLGYFKTGGAALKHRNYRLFFFGQLISLIGTWMQNLAQGWLVLKLTNSVLDLGVVTALQFTPLLFFTLFGGVLADRLPKRKTLLATQSTAMVLAFILALLTTLEVVQVWHVYILATLLGLVNALDVPTRQAFVPEMVGKKDLMNAVALNSSVFNAARAIGPAFAGILIGIVGISPAFWLNGLSYMAVIYCLSIMRLQDLHLGQGRKQTGSFASNLREGLSYAIKTPQVISIIVLVAMLGTFGINFNVWIPDLAKNHFNVGADGYGILMSGFGLGALASALTLAVKGHTPTFPTILKAGLLFGSFLIGVAISPWFWLSFGLMVGAGVSMMVVTVSSNTTIQLTTPDYLRGRVMSLYMLVFAGTTPIGSLFVGSLAHMWGTPFSIICGGLLTLLGVPLGWLVFRRKMRTNLNLSN